MKLQLLICIVIASVIQIITADKVGGWTPVEDVNSEKFQKITNFATKKISSRSNELHWMRPINVSNAAQQVVAGMNYEFTVTMGATECKKNKSPYSDINGCEFLKCGPKETCNVTVFDQPWNGNTRLTKSSCSRHPKSC